MGKTAVSEHIVSFDHSEGDIQYKILDFESDWRKRLVKETIAISRLEPNLNDNDGLFLSAIYDLIPTKFALETRSENRDDVINSKWKIEAFLLQRIQLENLLMKGAAELQKYI